MENTLAPWVTDDEFKTIVTDIESACGGKLNDRWKSRGLLGCCPQLSNIWFCYRHCHVIRRANGGDWTDAEYPTPPPWFSDLYEEEYRETCIDPRLFIARWRVKRLIVPELIDMGRTEEDTPVLCRTY